MKPARFDYLRAESVDHAAELLASYGDDAKIVAGGQSLMPMINFRLVRPKVVIDINRIPGLETIEEREDRLHIGALVRHRVTATHPAVRKRLPMLQEAMRHVAHMTVRNRGTFCGSVCHADPAAEMPMIAQMFEGVVEIVSSSARRTLPIADFLVDSLVNALSPDEMVTAISIRTPDPLSGWAFEEFSRRHGDFALAAFAVTLRVDADGAIRDARIGMAGVANTALRAGGLEALIEGRELSDGLLRDAAQWLHEHLDPSTDLHASADYRRMLAATLATRALPAAYARARNNQGRAHEH